MVSARDITEAKREARDTHINDDGRTDSNDIFTHVLDVFEIDDWDRLEDDEARLDLEYLFRRDDRLAALSMFRENGLWKVRGHGSFDDVADRFQFNQRKHAEARVVELMGGE